MTTRRKPATAGEMAAGGRVSIPAGARRTVADIKEVVGGHTDEEVYAMLRECDMDPNETAQRLLHQDTFHEVKRKRDKKKEGNKGTTNSWWRPALQGRGGRSVQGNYSSRTLSSFNDSTGQSTVAVKENGMHHIVEKGSCSIQAINTRMGVKTSSSTPRHSTGSYKASIEHKVGCDVPINKKGSSQQYISSFVRSSGRRASTTNYSSRSQQSCGSPKVIPSKEWKPKPTSSAASQAKPTSVAVGTIYQSYPKSNVVGADNLLKVDKIFNGLQLSDRQHVIIPEHLQVPDSEKCGIFFGSFNTSFQQTTGSSDTASNYNLSHECNGSDDEPQTMERLRQIKVVKDLQVKKGGAAASGVDSQSAHLVTSAPAVLPPLPNDEKTLATRVVRHSARSAIFTSKQAEVLHERFLAFLRGYKEKGCYFYKECARMMSKFGMTTMYIHYCHMEWFDRDLADTVRIFFNSVQSSMINAVQVFLNDETGSLWRNPLVKICDLPTSNSFMPLQQFWNLPGHNPSEEEVISSGNSSVTVVKITPSGRIPFQNLILKLFDDHGKGRTYGGRWGINDVMVNSNYDVEIMKPFCPTFKKKYLVKDFVRCADDIIPKLNVGGHLPAFFGNLRKSLKELLRNEAYITSIVWKKFFDFVTTHLSLRPPLNRSTLFDNVHQMLQTLGKSAKLLLEAILDSHAPFSDWASFLENGSPDVSPILSPPLS